MSDTIWVDIQGRKKDELPSDNTIMLRLKMELDALCQELRVAKLSSFYDYSELTAQYGDAEVADRESGFWFDPAPVLNAIQAISTSLSQNPEWLDFSHDAKRRRWREILLRELKSCESTLQQAASTGRKFRFLVIP